jgi:hypothetical protein
VVPKLLGIGAAIVAVAFILALPTVFEGEPASQVEPIRFGPPPLQELAAARVLVGPPLNPPNAAGLTRSAPLTVFAAPSPEPVITTGGRGPGVSADSGGAQPIVAGGGDDEAVQAGDHAGVAPGVGRSGEDVAEPETPAPAPEVGRGGDDDAGEDDDDDVGEDDGDD